MKQIEEAIRPLARPPGSGSRYDPETSKLPPSLFGQAGSLSQGSVWSNPFSDSHRISRISEVNVNDLDRVEVSTYQEEITVGQL